MSAPPRSDSDPIGVYANCLNIGFNAYEFVLDFGQSYPENRGPVICARIMASPAYAKAFAHVLTEAVEGYERSEGPIPEDFSV